VSFWLSAAPAGLPTLNPIEFELLLLLIIVHCTFRATQVTQVRGRSG
jgi:hypothetical protein